MGATTVAGVVGAPITHSLSPLIHNAWLAGARVDGVYVPFSPRPARFESLLDGLRGGVLAGLNVTLPFKERALEFADLTSPQSRMAGAANLLLFRDDGLIEARNTDGIGLLAAFSEQAPAWRSDVGPIVVLGAGGAARGAVSALVETGGAVRVVNRTLERAERLAEGFLGLEAFGLDQLERALNGASALINAAPLDPDTGLAVAASLRALPPAAVVMDMVYRPLETPLLAAARARGLATVDGLAMLIGQAKPSFEAMFGMAPPPEVDVRDLCECALKGSP